MYGNETYLSYTSVRFFLASDVTL